MQLDNLNDIYYSINSKKENEIKKIFILNGID